MSKTKRLVNPDTGEILDPKETPEYYTLDAIRHADVWTDENITAEYKRLRKIAQERLREISKSDIGRASKHGTIIRIDSNHLLNLDHTNARYYSQK